MSRVASVWLTIALRLFQQHPGNLGHESNATAHMISRLAAYTVLGQDAGRARSATVLSVAAALFD